jgi:hypothetical protein
MEGALRAFLLKIAISDAHLHPLPAGLSGGAEALCVFD